jgi:hypothetical protein
MPDNFDRWELADKDGWTVAHEAASLGKLPPGFSRLDLADNKGRTVAQAGSSKSNMRGKKHPKIR